MCPGWRRSKQPFVKTTQRPHRLSSETIFSALSRGITLSLYMKFGSLPGLSSGNASFFLFSGVKAEESSGLGTPCVTMGFSHDKSRRLYCSMLICRLWDGDEGCLM